MARKVKEWVGKDDNARPTKAVLVRLFEAAGGLCQKCGAKIGPKKWQADHIVRLKDGGPNSESNLQVLCIPCHQEKTVEENKAGAIALRKKTYHIGAREPSAWSMRLEKYRFNWKTRRYEPKP